MSSTEDYLRDAGGNKVKAAAALAADLMRGDRATLQQGYTIGNALLVTVDMFNLSAREVAELWTVLSPLIDKIEEAVLGPEGDDSA